MRILCTSPNAGALINGIPFHPNPDGPGVLSDDLAPEIAERFLRIPGYAQASAPAPKTTAPPTPPAPPRSKASTPKSEPPTLAAPAVKD